MDALAIGSNLGFFLTEEANSRFREPVITSRRTFDGPDTFNRESGALALAIASVPQISRAARPFQPNF